MYPVLFPVRHPDFPRMTPSAFTIAERFWRHVKKSDGCWEWFGQYHAKGYGWMRFTLRRHPSGNGKQGKQPKHAVRSHRLSWQLHFGEIPAGLGVLHTCDNPRCVRPDHLFLGTDKDNWEDAKKKGRRTKVRGKFAKGPNWK